MTERKYGAFYFRTRKKTVAAKALRERKAAKRKKFANSANLGDFAGNHKP